MIGLIFVITLFHVVYINSQTVTIVSSPAGTEISGMANIFTVYKQITLNLYMPMVHNLC